MPRSNESHGPFVPMASSRSRPDWQPVAEPFGTGVQPQPGGVTADRMLRKPRRGVAYSDLTELGSTML